MIPPTVVTPLAAYRRSNSHQTATPYSGASKIVVLLPGVVSTAIDRMPQLLKLFAQVEKKLPPPAVRLGDV
jgi:hypothetical protein